MSYLMGGRDRCGLLSILLISVKVALYIVILLYLAQSVIAATFNINSTDDVVDAVPGDGVCEIEAGSGECTLRAAIQEANSFPGSDSINVPSGTYTLNILGTDEDVSATGDLDVTDELIINGAGTTDTIIDGGKIDRVFEIIGTEVVINDLTIKNGVTNNGNGGGIRAIFGTLTINSCAVSDNMAATGGGGIGAFIGEGSITNSTISGNTASTGGGISSNGPMTIAHSTISGNTANFNGGGIHGGNFHLLDSTISDNSAVNGGGGIFPFGELTVINTTISDNRASFGAGIYDESAPISITNSTIAKNSAKVFGGGIYNEGFLFFVPEIELQNTILAENSAAIGGSECSGSTLASTVRFLTSLGNNFIGDPTGCSSALLTTDLTGDPGLGPFTDNGSPGNGHFPLLSNSPLIDAGNDDVCPDADQLGIERPADGNNDRIAVCDIGSIEFMEFVTLVSNRAVARDGNVAEEDITTGSVETQNAASSDLELTSDPQEGRIQVVGIRFPDVNIPKGSTVVDAYIQFIADEDQSGPVTITFNGEASDNAALFEETAGNLSNRQTTNASIDWSPNDWNSADAGPAQRTPNLAFLVQEIVERPGWTAGNAMAFIVTSDGSLNHRTAENSSTNGPILTIVFKTETSTFTSNRAVARDGNVAEEDITTGSVETQNAASSDLELTSDPQEGRIQVVGIRFPDVNIPKGSTVVDVYIQFIADEDQSGPVTITFNGEASDNAALFEETASNLSNRQTTNASIDWSPNDWNSADAGPAQRTPNLAFLVQEIVERPGWTAGNAMAFIVTSDGSLNHRTAENGRTNGPVLTILFLP